MSITSTKRGVKTAGGRRSGARENDLKNMSLGVLFLEGEEKSSSSTVTLNSLPLHMSGMNMSFPWFLHLVSYYNPKNKSAACVPCVFYGDTLL